MHSLAKETRWWFAAKCIVIIHMLYRCPRLENMVYSYSKHFRIKESNNESGSKISKNKLPPQYNSAYKPKLLSDHLFYLNYSTYKTITVAYIINLTEIST